MLLKSKLSLTSVVCKYRTESSLRIRANSRRDHASTQIEGRTKILQCLRGQMCRHSIEAIKRIDPNVQRRKQRPEGENMTAKTPACQRCGVQRQPGELMYSCTEGHLQHWRSFAALKGNYDCGRHLQQTRDKSAFGLGGLTESDARNRLESPSLVRSQ